MFCDDSIADAAEAERMRQNYYTKIMCHTPRRCFKFHVRKWYFLPWFCRVHVNTCVRSVELFLLSCLSVNNSGETAWRYFYCHVGSEFSVRKQKNKGAENERVEVLISQLFPRKLGLRQGMGLRGGSACTKPGSGNDEKEIEKGETEWAYSGGNHVRFSSCVGNANSCPISEMHASSKYRECSPKFHMRHATCHWWIIEAFKVKAALSGILS